MAFWLKIYHLAFLVDLKNKKLIISMFSSGRYFLKKEEESPCIQASQGANGL